MIPIVLASDENYAKQMYVTILSALENKKLATFYVFYLLVPEMFSSVFNAKFKTLESIYANCQINFVVMGNAFKDNEMQISHITTPTYYRLKIADILPKKYKKAIYLDVDTIVTQDLSEFFNINLDNYYIAGVKAFDYVINSNNSKYYNEIGLYDMSNYINAGVTLWNLEKIRKDDKTSELCKHVANNYKSMDQDIINLLFYGKIKTISLKYNLMTKYAKGLLRKDIAKHNLMRQVYMEDDFKSIISNPVIIHYADKIKPWNSLTCWLSSCWWRYAQKSHLFGNKLLCCYTPKFFSIKEQKNHKIITVLGIKLKLKNKN